eukprot:symbB.v1.2.036863.t1/scaffold5299.1/size28666/2
MNLDLWDNHIGDDGSQALAEGLKENSTLTHLVLRGNTIGPRGAEALAEGLKQNSTLMDLNLKSNNIGPRGVEALLSMFQQNTTLLYLEFDCDADLGEAIEEALERNRFILTESFNEHVVLGLRVQHWLKLWTKFPSPSFLLLPLGYRFGVLNSGDAQGFPAICHGTGV